MLQCPRRCPALAAGKVLLLVLTAGCSAARTSVDRSDSGRPLPPRVQEQADLGASAQQGDANSADLSDQDEAVPTLSSTAHWKHATVLVDVPIHLPDGMGSVAPDPVGFLRQGVSVFVTGGWDEYVSVTTPFPEAPSPVLTDRDLPWKLGDARSLVLNGISFHVPRSSRVRRWARVDLQKAERGYYRVLFDSQGRRLALVTCGPTTLLDVSGAYAQVAVDYPAGELWGRMIMKGLLTDPEPEALRTWDDACGYAIPRDQPQEYELPSRSAFTEAPMEQRMKIGDEFYFPEWVEGKAKCRRVRIAQKQSRAKLLLHYLGEDGGVIHARELARHGDRVSVHPYRLEPDGSLRYTASGLGWRLRAARVRGAAIGFVGLGYTKEESESEIRYFDPRALIWWDKSQEECEERLRMSLGPPAAWP